MQRPRCSGRSKGSVGGREARRPHVDAHPAVGHQAQGQQGVDGAHADRVGRRQPVVDAEAHEAARAVAALLHLAAVAAVEDAVAEVVVFAVGRLDHQQLVAAHAEAPIAQTADLRRIEREGRAGGVNDHEVIAGPLHLGEALSHGG
jgi:hypothetical protein